MADGMGRRAARARAEALLPKVGLPEENAILTLTYQGYAKKSRLARAIATDPDILLLDNPTAGLDPILAAKIDRMIKGLVDKKVRL